MVVECLKALEQSVAVAKRFPRHGISVRVGLLELKKPVGGRHNVLYFRAGPGFQVRQRVDQYRLVRDEFRCLLEFTHGRARSNAPFQDCLGLQIDRWRQ
jgi:hypothetical protein